MSKMDDLRAMREARYAAAEDRAARSRASRPASQPAGSGPAPRRAAQRQPPVAPGTAVPDDLAGSSTGASAPDAAAAAADLCGHRAISGRTCTRERGHAAKSHRYS